MSDVFLSYAYADRLRALAVRGVLLDHGWTVWMDNATVEDETRASPLEQLGVPPGQEYRYVIERAIEDASFFLAVDSETWRVREHCRVELEHATACGKRIIYVRDASPDLVSMESYRDLAQAHARAYAAFRGDTASPGWLTRWLAASPLAADAQLLQQADLGAAGLSLPPGGAEIIAAITSNERARQRTGRWAALSMIVVLTLMATVAITAGLAAAGDRHQAALSEAGARSLALADLALHARDTRTAEHLVQLAVAAQRNDTTTAALAQVQTEAAATRTILIPASHYWGAAMSPGGGQVALVRSDAVVLVNLTTGHVDTIAALQSLKHAIVFTDDGTGLVLSAKGELERFRAGSAELTRVGEGRYSSLSVDVDRNTWLIGNDGLLYALPSGAATPSLLGPTRLSMVERAVADPTRHVVYVLSGQQVRAVAYETDGTTVTLGREQWKGAIDRAGPGDDFAATGSRGGVYGPSLALCGHDIVAGQAWKVSIFDGRRHAIFSPEGRPAGPWTFTIGGNGSSCAPDGSAWSVGFLYSHAESYTVGGWFPADVIEEGTTAEDLAISGPHSDRTVIARPTGVLDIYAGRHIPWSRQMARTVAAQPLKGGMVYLDAEGIVRWDANGPGPVKSLGRVTGSAGALTAATDSAWYLTVRGHLMRVAPTAANPIYTYDAGIEGLHDPRLSADGKQVCALAGSDAVCLDAAPDSGPGRGVNAGNVGRPMVIELSLERGEVAIAAEWGDDRLLVTTNYGRILLLDPTGKQVAEVDATAFATTATFSPQSGQITAVTGDGYLRRYDTRLRQLSSTFVTSGGLLLRRLGDDKFLLGTTDYDLVVVDATTGHIVQVVAHHSADLPRAVPAPDGNSIITFTPTAAISGTDRPATLTVAPVSGAPVRLPD